MRLSPRSEKTTCLTAQLILAFGVTYAAVPLYRAFCSATGYSGTPMTDRSRFLPERLYASPETNRKRITVHFEATPSDALPWTFQPVTRSVKVLPGETALAFYTAKNTSDKDLIGIATYNMTPEKVGPSRDHIPQRSPYRLHRTLPKSSVSALKSKRSALGRRSTCPCSFSSTGTLTTSRVWTDWTTSC